MSAFIVDAEHIHVLVWAGLNIRYGPLRWRASDPTMPGGHHWRELTADTVDPTGQMLLDANIASVNHRYAENNGPAIYTWRTPRHRRWSPVELLKALNCYDYQASEPDDWEQSQAHAFVQELQGALIGQLPRYDDADTWGITASSEPAAHRDELAARQLDEALRRLHALRQERGTALEASDHVTVTRLDEEEVSVLDDVAYAAEIVNDQL